MGFSQVAAFAVILVGVTVFGSMVIEAALGAQKEERQAERERDRRVAAVARGAMEVVQFQYAPGIDQVTITVDNTGQTVLDGAGLDVVLDGVVVTQNISSRLVDGAATDVWTPGGRMVVVVQDITTGPDFAVLASQEGVLEYWRSG